MYHHFFQMKITTRVSIYIRKNILLYPTYEFAIDFNELQDILKIEISAIQQQYQWLVDVYKTLIPNFQIEQ